MSNRIGKPSRQGGLFIILLAAFLLFISGQFSTIAYADGGPNVEDPPIKAVDDSSDTGTGGASSYEPTEPETPSTLDVIIMTIQVLT